MKKRDTTSQNPKSGRGMAGEINPATLPKSKFARDYWLPRIYRSTYAADGTRRPVAEWSVRIQHAGRRTEIALGTNEAQTAARKAAKLYGRIRDVGWEAALAEFAPDRAPQETGFTTLGDVIAAAVTAKASEIAPRTLRDYLNGTRRLVALAFNIKSDESRFDYMTGGQAEWAAKLDRIKLDRLSKAKIQGALNKLIADARGNPLLERRARINAASMLRIGKAVFAAAAKTTSETILNPLTGLTVKAGEMPKYRSTIDAGQLLRAAKEQLATTDPEVYKAFLLGIGAGLRKGEIDALQWQMIDAEQNTIRVATTETFAPKTDGSEAAVFVDHGLIAELEVHRAKATSLYVLESKIAPRPGATFNHYRAKLTFERLTKWLRAQGVNEQKPLHALRKEFGSIINESAGIHAASRQLRHADILTTSRHYADNRLRVAPQIGAMLNPQTTEAKAGK